MFSPIYRWEQHQPGIHMLPSQPVHSLFIDNVILNTISFLFLGDIHVHTLFYLHGYSNRLHIDMAGFKVQCLVIVRGWISTKFIGECTFKIISTSLLAKPHSDLLESK